MSRFDLAYNAAQALCLAALRRAGYRASNRYIVFQVLPHTLGLGPEVWRVLDKCHNTRNLGEYEGLMDVWVFRSSVTGDSSDRYRYHFRSMKLGFRYRDRSFRRS